MRCEWSILYLVVGLLLGIPSCTSYEKSQVINVKNLTVKDNQYYLNDALYSGLVIDDVSGDPLIVREEFQVVNGLLEGYRRQWMEGEVLRTDKYFMAGKEEGIQKGYHTNGKLSFEYSIVEGKREGLSLENYPNGNLHIEALYHKDAIIAKKIFDPRGVTLTNYIIKKGRYYGFLGSSGCINVLNERYLEN